METSVYGKMIAVAGPMFAGKTETIIQAVTSKELVGFGVENPLILKHAFDKDRYEENYVVSHNQNKVPCQLADNNNIGIFVETAIDNAHDWVFIDEAQFFSNKSLLEACFVLLSSGISVCCVGLNQDSFGKPFGAMGDILAIADDIILIYSSCSICGMRASKTQRLSATTETVLVGASDSYEPRCLKHWVSNPRQGDL